MIQYLLFDTSKLLNISEITKRIGNFFKLPIQLFYSISYPELALVGNNRSPVGFCLTGDLSLPWFGFVSLVVDENRF